MLLFAPGESDLELHATFSPVQIQRNQRVAFTFHRAHEAVEFVSVHEQLPTARGLCMNVG